MSVLAKAPKLGVVNDKLIKTLLIPESSAGQILFVQEGVTLKGNTSHDAHTFLGTVFATQDEFDSVFILWLPYSYVYHIDPALVSPATKQSLALDKNTSPVSSPTKKNQESNNQQEVGDNKESSANNNNNETSQQQQSESASLSVMRAEWLFSQCIPFNSISRIRCKTTMRGKRVVAFQRSPHHASAKNKTTEENSQEEHSSSSNNNSSNFPMTFHDGGTEKLFSVLQNFSTIQPAPGGSQDDLIVTHTNAHLVMRNSSAAAASGASPSSPETDMQQFRDQTYSDSGGTTSASGTGGGKSGGEKKKVGARVWSGIVSAVSRGGKFLAEHFLDDDDENLQLTDSADNFKDPRNLRRKQGEGSGNTDDGFDMMEPLQDITEVKPKLKLPSKMPPRGNPLSKSQWQECFSDTNNSFSGTLNPEKFIEAREIAFKGGIEEEIRPEVWKYLLGVYPLDATPAARRKIDEENVTMYETVLNQWQSIGAAQEKMFQPFVDRRAAIDKDVARTDRTHVAFAQDHSEKLVSMRTLLLTYSFYNFDLGYCQGMSDLLAVLLLMYPTDAEVFAVFVRLMEKTSGNFHNGEKHTIAQQLRCIEVLIHSFVPPLYTHLQQQQATNMCFCFRWLLVLFKREFKLHDTIALWDVIFACPFSDQYEIIMATALLRAASDQIVDHYMEFDHLLKYANNLSTGLNDVTELIQASTEFYEFCAQQYEWTIKNNTSGEGDNKTSSSPNNSSSNDANEKKRPSVKELCECFDFKD